MVIKGKDVTTKSIKQSLNDFRDILTDNLNNCKQVYLVSHDKPDYDAIASLGAAALICKRHKKAPYIIINDNLEVLPDQINEMIDKIKEKFIVISLSDYEKNKDNNDLLIMVDVNKGFMTSLKDKYNQFKNIIIIDHHSEDKNTVKTDNKLITLNISSVSEIMYYLLNQYKIPASDCSYYTYLLAGIFLDTNKLSKNVFVTTYDAAKGLTSKGADQSKVNDFFSLDFESDRRVHNLVNKTIQYNMTVLISVCSDGNYTKEEIAKAADYALNYKCDAAIIAGKMEDGSYGISTRGKGIIRIDNIMNILNGGGGNLANASCPNFYADEDSQMIESIKDVLTFKKTTRIK